MLKTTGTRLWILLPTLWCATVWGKPSFARGTSVVPKETEPRPLVFLAPVNFPPWIISSEEQVPEGGLLYELAQELGQAVKLPVRVQALPYARFVELLGKQEFDFTIATKTQTVDKGYLFPKPAMTAKFGVAYLKEKSQFADCRKMKSVAHTSQSSTVFRDLIWKHCGKVDIVNTNSLEQRLKMLQHGRVDGYLGSHQEVDLIGWFGLPCDAIQLTSFIDISYHILVSEHSRLLQDEYKPGVERFLQSYYPEVFTKVRKKVLGKQYCPEIKVQESK